MGERDEGTSLRAAPPTPVRRLPLPATLEDKILNAEAVRDAVRGLRYGSVEIVIHDGRVVQVTRTEKVRIER
jgi:hypothetical protein